MADQVERKLTAILAADVAGYSRLMAADEEGTLARLKSHRRELIDPKIREHRGRIIKTTGDGLLIEFASVVDAVRCAVDVQRGMATANADVPPDRRIEFRAGINIGDVIVDGDDIYGDGVNIAARLENIADPGGIRVSANVRDQVLDKLGFGFDDLGEQSLKNIARPVRVYAVQTGEGTAPAPVGVAPAAAPHRAALRAASPPPAGGGRLGGGLIVGAALAVIVIVIVIVAIAAWYFLGRGPNLAANAPAHLSIVVLPFANLSNDPKQDYFADGITDNLTTDLSRIRNSFVIARNTAFTFKGKNVDAKEIGKELGVRYVLEGSVQRDGNRVRVNAQLIDAESGSHLWADRFEEDLADLFKMQDEIVARLANSLRVELVNAETQHIRSQNPDSTDLAMRGWSVMYRPPSRENLVAARELFDRATKLDATNIDAITGLAYADLRLSIYGSPDKQTEAYARAMAEVERGIAIDPSRGMIYYVKGSVLLYKMRDVETAQQVLVAAQTALRNDSALAGAYLVMAAAEEVLNKCADAKAHLEQAIRISPRDPEIGRWHAALSREQFCLGHFEEAINEANTALASAQRTFVSYVILAVAYAAAGRQDEAALAIEQARKKNPDLSVRWFHEHLPSFIDNPLGFLDAARKAGLPEDAAPPPPKHLSIVVLPFTNLSGDPKQDYFADGITDNLTTDLSRIRNSFVIARNTAFTYKGKNVDAKVIGKDLGVRYVLEGSVQRDGNRVRVNAQLIDAESGSHLWADRFEEDLADLFKLQDDVVARLANTLGYELEKAEAEKSARSTNPDSIDLTMRAWVQQWNTFGTNKAVNEVGLNMFEHALKLDPNNDEALVGLAYIYSNNFFLGLGSSSVDFDKNVIGNADRAIALNPANAMAYYIKSVHLTETKRFGDGFAAAEAGLGHNPNFAALYFARALASVALGRYEAARPDIAQAFRLSPRDPQIGIWHGLLGGVEIAVGNDDAALSEERKAIQAGYKGYLTHAYLASAYALLGKATEAAAELAEARRINPKLTVKWAMAHTIDPPRFYDGLRKAGLPADDGPRLSIVVLPFQNLSGDAKQDYLADVLTDELTTYISRIPGSFVIARNTAFTYKGKPTDVKTIGKDLSVHYVLEGSVQPTDKRIRTNAQLIDTETGAHLWAEEFDTDKTDLLQTEDEIVTRLARTLQIQLTDIEAAKLERAHPTNPDAQDLAMQCAAKVQHIPAGKEVDADLSACDRALALDPNNVLAMQSLAFKVWARVNYGQSVDRAADIQEAERLIARALALDPNNAQLYWIESSVFSLEQRFDEADVAAARSIALDPSDINAYWNSCLIQYLLGKPEQVVACIDKAIRLSPRDVRFSVLIAFKGNANFMLGRYEQSLEWYRQSLALNPNDPLNNIYFTAALSLAGHDAEAHAVLERYLATASPKSPRTIAAVMARRLSRNPLYLATYAHIGEGLRKAGMPEEEGPRLSIVVLPFQNLSGDAKQDYLADVLTDELTTYISRIPGSFVIARNTAFTYKGKPTDVKTIGKELGVRYALEGSVQPTDKRIRTNAQLIDTETGAHLWAEQFDNDKTDLLETEDAIVTRLARTLDVQLTFIEAARAGRVRPDNPDAQDLALRCSANFNESGTVRDPRKLAEIYEPCEQALRLDPRNVLALGLLGWRRAFAVIRGQSADTSTDMNLAGEFIGRALAVDPNDSVAHAAKGVLLTFQGHVDEAIVEEERSIVLNPTNMNAHAALCGSYNGLGQSEKALQCADTAIRLSPRDPVLYTFYFHRMWALFALQRDAEALEWANRTLALAPGSSLTLRFAIAELSRTGKEVEARQAYQRLVSLPGNPIKNIAQLKIYDARIWPATDPASVAARERLYAGLRKAGMPER